MNTFQSKGQHGIFLRTFFLFKDRIVCFKVLIAMETVLKLKRIKWAFKYLE